MILYFLRNINCQKQTKITLQFTHISHKKEAPYIPQLGTVRPADTM